MFKLFRRAVFRPGTYTGRLVCDGEGHLFAQENGREVAYDAETDSFVYVRPGDPSHNQRHERRRLVIEGTTPEQYAAGDPAHAHHYEPLPNDAHAVGDGTRKTQVVFNSDVDSPTAASHTDVRGQEVTQ